MNVPYPYHLTSAEQNRRMDSRTISEFGIDGFTLMELAGHRAADVLFKKTTPGSHAGICCGKGNNAGDALVIARLLSEQKYKCTLFFLMGTEDLSVDTQRNLELLKKLTGSITIKEYQSADDFSECDFLVDGIFGTGLSSEVREPVASIIQSMNKSGKPIIALDMPSGISSDTGRVLGVAVKAHTTLTFGALKAGAYLNDGFDYTGKVILCDLPFPSHFREQAAYLIDQDWVATQRINPTERRHKYADGVLYIIAGSEGLTGATVLAARSAWSQDIGAVVVPSPRGLLDIYEKNLVQIIKKPIGNKNDVYFSSDHLSAVQQIIQEKPGIVLIGPGMGRSEESIRFIRSFLENYEGKVIIDADGIFALTYPAPIEKPEKADWLLTPHPGELVRLLHSEAVQNDDFDRLLQVTAYAKKKDITIVSKGRPSIVASRKGEAYLTGYDTHIFSRAGFGDVLAGKIGAFWLLGKNAELAAIQALLDGKSKADEALEFSDSPLEPLDII